MCDVLFTVFPNYIYYEDFAYITQFITSELYFSLYDLFFQSIPCVQNFLFMRSNFNNGILNMFKDPSVFEGFRILPSPVLTKSIEKLTNTVGEEIVGNLK